MKKITQNLTNVKAWQSIVFAFMFLFSLTINSQEVGDEFLANPGVNTANVDADTGFNGSGGFNANNGYGGWTAGTGGAYAAGTDTQSASGNGECHTTDRQFRLYKVGGADGQFINQIVTALPAGNYNYGFWNKWDFTNSNDAEVSPTWGAEGDVTPKFSIKVQDADNNWQTVHTHVPAEPSADMTWVEETGTWTNEETRDVRVMFYKNGGTNAAPTNLNNLWYVDTTTLNYASPLETSSDCELTVNMVDTYGDGWGSGNYLEISVNGVAIEGSPFTVDTTTNSVTLDTNYGDSVTFNVVGGGSWSSEMEVTIGNTVLGAGDSYTFECIDPDAVYFDASVTTDGAFATFSLTVNNFTVGAAAGEGDGHIHWSIYDSADLETAIASGMIYSTEDVTLPLPNGNHTMVFSLVDPNHQPFDPPIESTVVFSTFDGIYSGDYPYCSSFDTDALDNWSVESVSGDANWTSSAANQNSTVAPLTGAGMAYIYDNASVSNLISPSMDLSSASSASVSFSYTQAAWTPDQDELRVWYRAASGDEWSQIGEYTAEATEWTAVTLDLPNLSATYQVAFNGTAAYGRGITVDDVCIATVEPAALSLQGIMDFTTPGAWFRGLHVVASADIPDLSVYALGVATNGGGTDGIEIELTGSAAAGDNILIARSANATADIIDVYLNATDLYDQIIIQNENTAFASNGDDAIELFFNGEVIETYGDIDVDGSGESWEYMDSWAWKQADGTWINGDVNCTDGSFLMWDSGCVYPFVVDQQCTGASTDLVTAFSHDFEAVGPAGYWWVNAQAGTFRVDDPITADGSGGNDYNGVMEYTDDGSEAYSNLQMRFCSKLDLNSVNTVSLRAMIISGETLTGTQNNQLALKLQDATDNEPWNNQNTVEQDITVTDEWVDLVFTFNDAASMARTDVDNIVINLMVKAIMTQLLLI